MIDLSPVLLEFVARGGHPTVQNLQNGYRENKPHKVYGLSVSFHPGYTLDQLARSSSFRHGTLSYATVHEIRAALNAVGFEMMLTFTPSANNPDHHDLSVKHNGVMQIDLPTPAARALSQVLRNIPNPYKAP